MPHETTKIAVGQNRKCDVCGKTYPMRSFCLDPELCHACKENRKALGIRHSVISICKFEIACHLGLLVLFCLLAGVGEFALAGMLYCLTIIIYCALRIYFTPEKRHTIRLQPTDALLFLMLPLFGPVAFIAVFHIARAFKLLLL